LIADFSNLHQQLTSVLTVSDEKRRKLQSRTLHINVLSS